MPIYNTSYLLKNPRFRVLLIWTKKCRLLGQNLQTRNQSGYPDYVEMCYSVENIPTLNPEKDSDAFLTPEYRYIFK